MLLTHTYGRMSAPSRVARVRAVEAEGRRVFLELPDGTTASVDATEPLPFAPGAVVLVRADDNHIEAAPDELWPEVTWVGVVRLKNDDVTVVDRSGKWRMVPTRRDIDYSERNTVEASSYKGVLRVLSEGPLKYIEMPAIDDAFIAQVQAARSRARDV